MFSINVYVERLCAYVGIEDGGSERKHDRKHQSDDGLVDSCHYIIRCADAFCAPLGCAITACALQTVTPSHCAAMYNTFCSVIAYQKLRRLMSPCSFCQCKHYALWLLKQLLFSQSISYMQPRAGPSDDEADWLYASHEGHIDGSLQT